MVLNDEAWHIVKSIPKVTGFVGGSTNPPSIPPEEVAHITRQMEEGAQRPKPKVRFEKGAVGSKHTHPHEQTTYVLSGEFEFTATTR